MQGWIAHFYAFLLTSFDTRFGKVAFVPGPVAVFLLCSI